MSLKKQLEDILCNLNKAYQKLDYNKNTLNQQSDNVKEQIKSNIMMQVENLNQRKQWLLNQLELVKSDKMESIQRKQDAIKCSLSNIQKLLCDPPKYGNNQIKESIESINSLMSEETRPFIAFRSDPALLREIISQYGVILKQYCGHFADPTRPSISLPSVVEEEDDEDSVTFNKKEDSTRNQEETNTMHIPIYPSNSSIVRAWLMATNDFANNIEGDVGTPKSDSDSFVKVDSLKEIESKEVRDALASEDSRECKEVWLSGKVRQTVKSENADIVKPFIDIKNQPNCLWLSGSTSIDEDKEVDHCELLKKACIIGNCKSFLDCCEKENCCNRLIDPDRPSWNKWLLDNKVFKKELLNQQTSLSDSASIFSKKFKKVLKSDSEQWLDLRKGVEKTSHKTEENEKHSKIISGGRVSIFNEPLETWISWAHEIDRKINKSESGESISKSMNKTRFNVLEGEDTNRWLVDRPI